MNSQSGFATLKIIFYLALVPFAMTQWVAAELQLVGGHATAYQRVYYPDFPEYAESKTVTLTSAQLQPYHPPTTLLSTYSAGWGDSLWITSSLEASKFNILHFANIRPLPYGREAEFESRLQFLIPATRIAPAGTTVKVKVLAPASGVALDSDGKLLAPDFVSTVDGRESTHIVRFAGQTLDLSATTGEFEIVGEVQTGTPFWVEVDFLGIGVGDGNPKITGASVTVTEVSQMIEFNAPEEVFLSEVDEFSGLGGLWLDATATSGLPVSFEIVSGSGTLWGDILSATNFGEITVRASQAGNAQYDAAPNVERTIHVVPDIGPIATVTRLQGTVTATDLFGNVVQLKVGDLIHPRMLVGTALRSFVQITVSDGSRIQIGPKSRMQITYDMSNRSIDLHQGYIWIQKTKPLSVDDPKLKVKTKTAALGVRGTILTVEVTDENGIFTTTTEVLEGVVDHENLLTGEMTELLAGDLISIEAPSDSNAGTPARLAKIAALKSKIAILNRKLKVYKKQRNKTKIAATNRSIRILKAQLASA